MQIYKQPRGSQASRIIVICLSLQLCFHMVLPEVVNTRLSGGLASHEGRVEIFYDESWNTICDDQWDFREASVVCRQLGYEDAEVAFSNSFFGPGRGRILLDELKCNGDEQSLLDCPSDGYFNHNCDHTEDAGVRCLQNDTYIGEVRLVGGTAAHEGRVEIYYENEWGTLCDKHWDLNDARVICRQLGHKGAYRIYDGRYFGEGTGPILSQMDCDGDESFWLHCNFNGWNTTGCEHRHDSGVTCSHLEPFPTPHDGSLRLAEGLSTNVGRVEIYYQGEWGTICGNEWTYGDAGVICRQLGYPGVDSFSKGSPYEEGSGPIMGVLGCRGYEWFWQDCPFDEWSTPYCSHTEDANVACSLTAGTPKEGNLRLNGANAEYHGRLEIFHHDEWGTVCDNGWSINEENVACRQLGFTEAYSYDVSASFGNATGPIMLDKVDCKGSEHYLAHCDHNGWLNHDCTHEQDVGVSCKIPDTYFPRLVDGEQWNEGRVEVWDGTRWERYCTTNFDIDEARVVCQQIGFPDYEVILPNDQFGVGFSPPSDVGFHCSSTENELAVCVVSPIKYTSYCGSVAVRCKTDYRPNQLSAGAIAFILIVTVCLLVAIVTFFPVIFKRSHKRRGQDRERITEDVTYYEDYMGDKPVAQVQAPPSYNDAVNNPPGYSESSAVLPVATVEKSAVLSGAKMSPEES